MAELTKEAESLIRACPEVVNALAAHMGARADAQVIYGRARTNYCRVLSMREEELARLIWETLSGFPSEAAIVAWLREPAEEGEA